MDGRVKVAVIYGSAREGRFCDTVASWAVAQVEKDERFVLQTVDPASDSGKVDGKLRERIHEADAFVVVTPEYNHGYPGALKSMIDSVGQGWHAKPVAFVSYGGVSGGLRAVEQLRLVFAELHAVTVRDSVSFASAWEQFDGSGALNSPARAERTMAGMLNKLHWWAAALRNAREATPYSTAA